MTESDALPRLHSEALVVRAAVPRLDELVARLVGAGIAVRELAPAISPLEAAFVSLTGGTGDVDAEEEVA